MEEEKEAYGYVRKIYDENLFAISNIEEKIQLIIYSLISFFIPFVLSHPQIVVGAVVNCALILGATYLKGHKMLPLIMLPSLGVLASGLLFGKFTIFLVYMVPFIWIGNALYAYGYRHLSQKKTNKALSIIFPSIIKSAFLFGITFALVNAGVLPTIFLASMGIVQLLTALIGGTAAGIIVKIRKNISY